MDRGFRLPSALDNRPLTFDEFEENESSYLRFSDTGPYELEQSPEVIEQIIRPTGLLDPPIDIRPIEGQIDDLLGDSRSHCKNERVLITTLTKKMSEDLTDYLKM